ncbi:MAG: peroxiredoxin [Rhodocyclales bacterium CG17_big_fil_post_rev_8_21_14_2_50_68_7]|nr:MAG: peroxiredoxin [Rhodocyclales bacterium CG17_big_fil_post_rev_8_21_14_2_50_68_7]PJA57921.1 MAG: peroxiredoxin [Rhodocyclales bacterium CG_4_9_14_3_um_filter_68_10]
MNQEPGITLTHQGGYRFLIDFAPAAASLLADEAAPLGEGVGPTPGQLLAAAVANCLGASLLFALKKFKQDPSGLRAAATIRTGRNAENRLRVEEIRVDIALGRPGGEIEHLARILDQFENFCTVSQSVRAGIPIAVTVTDVGGITLKGDGRAAR